MARSGELRRYPLPIKPKPICSCFLKPADGKQKRTEKGQTSHSLNLPATLVLAPEVTLPFTLTRMGLIFVSPETVGWDC